MSDIRTEQVNIVPGELPADYHCRCDYCKKYLGELVRANGEHYKRTDRRAYYANEVERHHFAKTPLHVARWAIQTYSKLGDWVFDPTIGAGTTAVEALNHGRNVMGIEIQFIDVIRANIDKQGIIPNDIGEPLYKIVHNDARNVVQILAVKAPSEGFDLVVNNPPYSGDKQAIRGYAADVKPAYSEEFANLAFAKEGDDYWRDMAIIYSACVASMKSGAHLVVGVKDMMRNKKPFLLHKMLADLQSNIPGLSFVGVALLLHHPSTQFLNTYPLRYGIPVPKYQTITVFRKD